MNYIRIISIPNGKAPRFVRRAWLGLELPFITPADATPIPTTAARLIQSNGGYIVKATEALTVLYRSSPKAANWWRRNLPPSPNNEFVFERENCELIC
jgi:hypothetical protein